MKTPLPVHAVVEASRYDDTANSPSSSICEPAAWRPDTFAVKLGGTWTLLPAVHTHSAFPGSRSSDQLAGTFQASLWLPMNVFVQSGVRTMLRLVGADSRPSEFFAYRETE